MPDVWDPPPDHSGGFFIFQYTNGPSRHTARIHVDVYNVLTLQYTTAHGTEIAVADTINNYLDQWKAFFTNAWTASLVSLWAIESGVVVPISVPPVITPRVGTNGGSEAASPAGGNIWNFHTTIGGKMRIEQIAPSGWTPAGVAVYTSASAGLPGTFMTYISGGNCAIVGHDGGKPLNYARVTTPIFRKIRRHLHLD